MMQNTSLLAIRTKLAWFACVLVCASLLAGAHHCRADIIFDSLVPGAGGSALVGTNHIGQIIHFNNPGTYDITSLDMKLRLFNASHNNVTAQVTLFENPDLNNSTNIFTNQIAQHTFQLGNLTGTPAFQTFNFDFAAQNISPRVTDLLGVTVRLMQNGQPSSGLGFGIVINTTNPMLILDDDENGLFSSVEVGLFGNFNSQVRLHGNSVTAVPEPSSLMLCGLIGVVTSLRRKRTT